MKESTSGARAMNHLYYGDNLTVLRDSPEKDADNMKDATVGFLGET